MCIGNRNGGDDAVGPYIADQLKDSEFMVIDCGTVPENYTGVVKQHKPDNVVIIDAVEMGLDPGETRIVPKDKIGVMHVSTHGIPISVLMNYLEQHVKNIVFIGIQPKNMSGNMTDVVKESTDKLVEIIKNKELKNIPSL